MGGGDKKLVILVWNRGRAYVGRTGDRRARNFENLGGKRESVDRAPMWVWPSSARTRHGTERGREGQVALHL